MLFGIVFQRTDLLMINELIPLYEVFVVRRSPYILAFKLYGVSLTFKNFHLKIISKTISNFFHEYSQLFALKEVFRNYLKCNYVTLWIFSVLFLDGLQ